MFGRSKNPFKGSRYINLIRCSTEPQGPTSPKAQIRVNNEFAKRVGMIHVKDVILTGVSGSQTFNRADLEELVREKVDRNTYDVILFRDLSRLTRGGIQHGHTIKRNFARIGVKLQSVTDHIPDGPLGELMETFLFFQNQEFSRSISKWFVNGLVSSIKSGRRPPGGNAPYGFDKLLLVDGKASRLLRRNATHRQLLKPDTNEVMEEMERHLPFRKHQFETYRYVLGDPKRVQVVRTIFEQFHKHARTETQIAHMLNARGELSPFGKLWGWKSVKIILENPMYVGRLIAFRQSAALYYHASAEDGLCASVIDQLVLEGKRWTVPSVRLPKRHWYEIRDTEAAKILDDPLVQQRAAAHIQRVLDNWTAKPTRKRQWRSIQTQSFLREIIKLKGYPDKPMCGMDSKDGNGKRVRYYGVRRPKIMGRDALGRVPHPADWSVQKRLIPAVAVERMVWDAVINMLRDSEFIRQSVDRHKADLSQRRHVGSASKEKELRNLELRLDFLTRTLNEGNRQRYEREVASIQKRQAELAAMAPSSQEPREPEHNLKRVAARVMDQLQQFPSKDTSAEVLDRVAFLMRTVVKRLEVDPLTREVEMELIVPSWAMTKGAVPADTFLSPVLAPCVPCGNGNTESQVPLAAKRRQRQEIAAFRGQLPFHKAKEGLRNPLYSVQRVDA